MAARTARASSSPGAVTVIVTFLVAALPSLAAEGHPAGDVTVCADNGDAGLSLSWCAATNPFLTYLPAPGLTVNEPGLDLNFTCDGSGLDANCGLPTGVATAQYQQALFLFYGLETGGVVGARSLVNTANTSDFVVHSPQPALVAGDGGVPRTTHVAAVGLDSSAIVASVSVPESLQRPGAASAPQAASLMMHSVSGFGGVGNSSGGDAPSVAQCTGTSGVALANGEVLGLQAFRPLGGDSGAQAAPGVGQAEVDRVIAVVLLEGRDGNSSRLAYSLEFTEVHVTVQPGGERVGCQVASHWSWDVTPHDSVVIGPGQLSLAVAEQRLASANTSIVWNRPMSSPDSIATSQTLIVLSSATRVAIYGFDPTPPSVPQRLLLPFGDPTAASTFYVAADSETVTSATVFGDTIRRIEFNGTSKESQALCESSLNASQLLWLTVSLTSGGNSSGAELRTVALSEFAQVGVPVEGHGVEAAGPAVPASLPPRVLNPANRALSTSSGHRCNVSSTWLDKVTQTCYYRQVLSLALDMPATALRSSTRTMPSNLPFPSIPQLIISTLDNDLVNTTLQTLCEAQYILNHDKAQFQKCLAEAKREASAYGLCNDFEVVRNSTLVGELLKHFLYTVVFADMGPVPRHGSGASDSGNDGYYTQMPVFVFHQPLIPAEHSRSAPFSDGERPFVGKLQHAPAAPVERVEFMTQLNLLGEVVDFHATPNSLYLMAAVRRPKWQLLSSERLSAICEDLETQGEDDPFLHPFSSACRLLAESESLLGGRSDTGWLREFGWSVSVCPPGLYCPSFSDVVVPVSEVSGAAASQLPTTKTGPAEVAPAGTFTNWAYRLEMCDEGHFCSSGQRHACPPGKQCPSSGMGLPLPCTASSFYNSTCFNMDAADGSGTVEQAPCPDGAVCVVPYYGGLLAAPGSYVIPADRATVHECDSGEWCSLGRYDRSDLSCPAFYYCSDPAVIEPQRCPFNASYASYCPGRSTVPEPCPPGFYCPLPNVTHKCSEHQYCPPGSLTDLPCPAGSFCPTPAEKEECPEGSYCHAGSLRPIACNFLASCPAGSANEARSSLQVVIIIAIVVAGVLAWRVHLRRQAAARKRLRKLYETEANEEAMALRAARLAKLHTHANAGAPGTVTVRHSARVGRATASEEVATAGNRARGTHSVAARAAGQSAPTERLTTPLLSSERSGTELAMVTSGAADDDEETDPLTSFGGLGAKAFTMDFTFRDLGLELKQSKKKVVAGVSGRILHGRLTAIMGPSGAGKTSFLSALSGRASSYGNVTGSIRINGRIDSIGMYKKLVGFVPQEDIMHRELTVWENLRHSAITRLPESMGLADKERVVRDVMRILDLTEIAHSIIGDEDVRGISGGQRKRVNIGMELCAYPTVLFLDEPTSGLDSASSYEVVGALKRVAKSLGLTVVAVIHQPRYEIFIKFDDTLLLGKGGRTCYLGPSDKALPYFESLGHKCPELTSPSDHFMDVIAADTKGLLFDAWEVHQEEVEHSAADSVRTVETDATGATSSTSGSGAASPAGARPGTAAGPGGGGGGAAAMGLQEASRAAIADVDVVDDSVPHLEDSVVKLGEIEDKMDAKALSSWRKCFWASALTLPLGLIFTDCHRVPADTFESPDIAYRRQQRRVHRGVSLEPDASHGWAAAEAAAVKRAAASDAHAAEHRRRLLLSSSSRGMGVDAGELERAHGAAAGAAAAAYDDEAAAGFPATMSSRAARGMRLVYISPAVAARWGGVAGILTTVTLGSVVAVLQGLVISILTDAGTSMEFFTATWLLILMPVLFGVYKVRRIYLRRRESWRERMQELAAAQAEVGAASPTSSRRAKREAARRWEAALDAAARSEKEELLLVSNILYFLLAATFLGPFGAAYVYLRRRQNKAARLVALFGFATQLLIIGVFFVVLFQVAREVSHWQCRHCAPFTAAGASFVCFYVMIVVVFLHRHSRVPSAERRTAGSIAQFSIFVRRAIAQSTRQWGAVLFDFSMTLMAGLFLGVLFLNKEYQGALPSQVVDECPAPLREVCSMPLYDPIIGQASLSCLALSLAAVASSLRVFGREKVVFGREATTGTSTEAYFLGRSVAHLPTIFLAPLLFCLMFTQLASPLASFWSYYALFVLVYATSAGMGYMISIILSDATANLVGVLAVLVAMMFSGAGGGATLKQLADPHLLGGVLIVPTYFSFVRWAQEAFYLLEIRQWAALYDVSQGMSVLSYDWDDERTCWLALGAFLLAFRCIAFVALVKREP